jgi:hypothetical protein
MSNSTLLFCGSDEYFKKQFSTLLESFRKPNYRKNLVSLAVDALKVALTLSGGIWPLERHEAIATCYCDSLPIALMANQLLGIWSRLYMKENPVHLSRI